MSDSSPDAASPPDAAAPPDAAPTLAVLGFSGHAMRYAEVAPGPQLVRLGACDFEASAEAALFGAEDPAALATVESALRDVFAGTTARALVVVVPATASTAFFTPLPAGLPAADRDGQIRQEAALLADIPSAVPVRVRAVPVRAEAVSDAAGDGARLWYHVLHVSDAVHARLGRLASVLGVASYDVADAGRGAAAVVHALGGAPGAPAADLVVGAYGDHTEAVVVRGGEFVFAHHGPGTTAEDTAYYALAALDAAGLDAASVGRVFATGDAEAGAAGRFEVLGALAGPAAVPLNPIGLFGQPVESASAWELAAFASVLGAALSATPAAPPPATGASA